MNKKEPAMIDNFLQGFALVTTLPCIGLMITGVATGVIFGAIPGLTGGIAIAIALPFTFYMSAVEGLSLLAGIYVGGTFGGSIASILFGTPGSPEAAVTVVDGYPLARKGYPSKALNTALYASAFASVLS
jgi:putative tricarboxylic transport membrane protein